MHNLLLNSARLFIFCFVILTFSQCTEQQGDYKIVPVYTDPSNFTNEIPMAWNQLMLDMERYDPGYKSPVAARTLAYINIAAFESIYPAISDRYNSIAQRYLFVQLPSVDPGQNYFFPLSMNTCYKDCLINFYKNSNPEQLRKILWLYEELNVKYSQNIDAATSLRSSEFGKKIAKSIYDWSKTDLVGHEAYLRINDPNYSAPAGDGLWKPTFPDFGAAILPNWGNMRTFVASHDDLQLPAPPAYSTDPGSVMYKEAKYVHDLTESARADKDGEDYWIGQFWSDDFSTLTFTPAGRWTAIATQIMQIEKVNMVDAAVVYAKVSIALSDAAIGSWENKYKYNTERPVDYIRTNIDPNWNTILIPDQTKKCYTPQSPSYPSEHAAYAAAAAGVLNNIFGTQYKLVDNCHKGRLEFRSDPRTFYSFNQIADEVAYSRSAAGVHYPSDAQAGLSLGKKIAATVNNIVVEK